MTTRPAPATKIRRGYDFVQSELKARATRAAKLQAQATAAAAQDPAKARAEKIFADVAAGRTVFVKAGSMWTVCGPADKVREHLDVKVTKADGTTKVVEVDQVQVTSEKRGVRYCVATFTEVPAWRRTPAARPRPRTVRSAAFGRGVQYGDGATVYAGVGGGRTQIWDD